MEPKFVTHISDAKGVTAVAILRDLGYQTEMLMDGQQAANGTVAVFTPQKTIMQGCSGRYLRCSAIKLGSGIAPTWAESTPFRVAVIRTDKASTNRRKSGSLVDALQVVGSDYRRWNPGEGKIVPWAAYEKDPSIKQDSPCLTAAKKWLSTINLTLIVRALEEVIDPSVQHMFVNAWKVNYTDEEIVFPDSAVEEALGFLAAWSDHFPAEETWIRKQIGRPSLVVRFDCVVRDGKLVVYEVEERPSGMGISSIVNPFFANRLQSVARTWPDFSVVISPFREGTDDYIWLSELNRKQRGDLVLVRAEPEETGYHYLEPHSVSSLKAKGDKGYGEQMGLWQRVTDVQDLPWQEGFVLKPLVGSKMKEVEIWDPLRRPGASNKQRIDAAFARNQSMFIQKLEDPLPTGRAKFCWMIYRVFFGFNVRLSQWECLGGNWNARSNLRIHGASDALFGPVVLA